MIYLRKDVTILIKWRVLLGCISIMLITALILSFALGYCVGTDRSEQAAKEAYKKSEEQTVLVIPGYRTCPHCGKSISFRNGEFYSAY